jgi:hypothetical protein
MSVRPSATNLKRGLRGRADTLGSLAGCEGVAWFGSSFGLFMSGLPPFGMDDAIDHTSASRPSAEAPSSMRVSLQCGMQNAECRMKTIYRITEA